MTHEETIKRIQKLVPSTVQTVSHLFKNNNLRCSHCGATSQQEYDGLDCTEKRYKPITLCHILLAIKTLVCKRCKGAGGTLGYGMGYSECEDCGGDKYDLPEDFAGGEFELGDILGFWNLSKDNFNDQSEETKTFIGGLLN